MAKNRKNNSPSSVRRRGTYWRQIRQRELRESLEEEGIRLRKRNRSLSGESIHAKLGDNTDVD